MQVKQVTKYLGRKRIAPIKSNLTISEKENICIMFSHKYQQVIRLTIIDTISKN